MEPIFFYSHKPGKPYAWGSNWFKTNFVHKGSDLLFQIQEIEIADGTQFATREQYMMFGKARLFGDEKTAIAIMATDDPSEAKKLGRVVKDFEEIAWKEVAFEHVANAIYLQFMQNPELKQALLETGDRELVEASKDDRVWGIGYLTSEKDVALANRAKWGQNLLGKALMRVREAISLESLEGKK
jgi:ribA/ribD-fused uncharacterized protein